MLNWSEILSRLDEDELDALNNPKLNEAGDPIYTAWIYLSSDEELRRQELTSKYSDLNSKSLTGQTCVPLIVKEMARRGLTGYITDSDDEYWKQMGDILSGNIE